MRRHAGIGSRASRLAGVRQSSDASADRSNECIHATAGRPRGTAASLPKGRRRRGWPCVPLDFERSAPRSASTGARLTSTRGSRLLGIRPWQARHRTLFVTPASGSTSSPTPTLTHANQRGSVKGYDIAANHAPVRLSDRSASPGPSVCRCRSPGEDWDFSREAA